MEQQEIKSNVIKIGAVVAGIVVLAIALPLIYSAFLASLGLAGIAIIGGIGIAAVKAIPYMGQVINNRLIAAQVHEAEANPIAQMDNKIIRDAQEISYSEQAYATVCAQITNMNKMVSDQIKDDPGYDASDEKSDLRDMEQYKVAMSDEIIQAKRDLEDYKVNVKRWKMKTKFAEAGQQVMGVMNKDTAIKVRQSILDDAALQASATKYNGTMAALRIRTQKLSSANQLSFNRGTTIDVSSIKIPERIEAK